MINIFLFYSLCICYCNHSGNCERQFLAWPVQWNTRSVWKMLEIYSRAGCRILQTLVRILTFVTSYITMVEFLQMIKFVVCRIQLPQLQISFFFLGMYHVGDETSWNSVFDKFVAEKDSAEKLGLLRGLTAIRSVWILNKYVIHCRTFQSIHRQNLPLFNTWTIERQPSISQQ